MGRWVTRARCHWRSGITTVLTTSATHTTATVQETSPLEASQKDAPATSTWAAVVATSSTVLKRSRIMVLT